LATNKTLGYDMPRVKLKMMCRGYEPDTKAPTYSCPDRWKLQRRNKNWWS